VNLSVGIALLASAKKLGGRVVGGSALLYGLALTFALVLDRPFTTVNFYEAHRYPDAVPFRAIEAADRALGGADAVVVTAGDFATQAALEGDLDLAERVLSIDFTATVLFCEHARQLLLSRGGGTLCVFSSVAGDRGRMPVVLYGAAKAGLSYYLEALDHKYRGEGLRVVCVKPGFVRTGMTAGLEPPPPVPMPP